MQTTKFLFSAKRMSLTYGDLPEFEVFEECWAGDIGPFDVTCPYRITNCPRVGNQEYFTPGELYDALECATRSFHNGSDDAGEWASAVLSTFGIEWVWGTSDQRKEGTDIVADDVECNCDVSGPVQCDMHGPRE